MKIKLNESEFEQLKRIKTMVTNIKSQPEMEILDQLQTSKVIKNFQKAYKRPEKFPVGDKSEGAPRTQSQLVSGGVLFGEEDSEQDASFKQSEEFKSLEDKLQTPMQEVVPRHFSPIKEEPKQPASTIASPEMNQ
jgi:hypothetical protein